MQAFTGMAAHRVLSPLPGHCRIRSNLGLGTSGAGVRPVCQGACQGARARTPCRRRRGCPACCPVASRSRPEAARTAGPCTPSSAVVAATLRTLTSPHQLLFTSIHPPSGAHQTINVLYVPQHEKVRDIQDFAGSKDGFNSGIFHSTQHSSLRRGGWQCEGTPGTMGMNGWPGTNCCCTAH